MKSENVKLLDESELGEKLFELTFDFATNGKTAILVDRDGIEWCLIDWQGEYPETLIEAAGYDWVKLLEVDF
jgi:hypothetical protein